MAKHLTPQSLRSALVNYSVVSDRRSGRTLSRAFRGEGRSRELIRIRALGGAPVSIRPGTTDCLVLREVFAFRHHMPPVGLKPHLIFDLGANNGMTTAHLAETFPAAIVIGVEPDPENAAIARENVAGWPNAQIVEAAIWTERGTVRLAGPGHASLRVSETGEREVEALTLNDLVARHGTPDYVKFDVEGAERELLRENTAWARAHPVLNVEVHDFPVEECLGELRSLGYRAERASEHEWPIVYARP